ncbi:hypothetical protein NG54_03325 [Heyndrickxia ginsengihumi]|uniref:Uncharacterized protein n=1 Tax=Heyndrickxia ginsengihumi TaxID=363870 RepID=A0A0A6VFL6_9BACI|nr:hypothetical protein [Heyndrickxia ginsengihumi]KHD86361.1 hypothetical protein NG54_03325 [Heyndrickxia ginsengihumi]
MDDNPLKGINFSKFNFSLPNVNPIGPTIQQMNESMRSAERAIREKQEREEQYKENVLNTLMNIERNTGDISALISLVQKSNDTREEVLNILKEIWDISSAQTVEEADSKYRSVMDKANKLNQDVEMTLNLINYGKTIWLAVKEYIKNPF